MIHTLNMISIYLPILLGHSSLAEFCDLHGNDNSIDKTVVPLNFSNGMIGISNINRELSQQPSFEVLLFHEDNNEPFIITCCI